MHPRVRFSGPIRGNSEVNSRGQRRPDALSGHSDCDVIFRVHPSPFVAFCDKAQFRAAVTVPSIVQVIGGDA
jgi:hypothetical protein